MPDPPRPRPLVVPVFLPHAGCPHRCAFCNQNALTGAVRPLPTDRELRRRIESVLATRTAGRSPAEIAFYGGNALGMPGAEIDRCFSLAAEFVASGRVDGIRCSTRPDTVSDDALDRLSRLPLTTIELGVQSMDDEVLARSRRGHGAACVREAVDALKGRSIRVGIQLMIGLPGDDERRALDTARRVADLAPDFVRIYPTLVLSGSPLAERYRRGAYRPLGLEEAVRLAARLYRRFRRRGIRVARMGLQDTAGLSRPGAVLAGPHHPAFGELAVGRCFLEAAAAAVAALPRVPDPLVLRVHPRSESKCRGWRNANIAALRGRFRPGSVRVEADGAMDEAAVAVAGRPPVRLTDVRSREEVRP